MSQQSAVDYVNRTIQLRSRLIHALEQVDKDQHLNASTAIAEASLLTLECLNDWLKTTDAADFRRRISAERLRQADIRGPMAGGESTTVRHHRDEPMAKLTDDELRALDRLDRVVGLLSTDLEGPLMSLLGLADMELAARQREGG